MLKIDNVTISYKKVPAVLDFSLDMKPGQIISLVGESGSGKTTVIRAVLGLLAGGGAITKGDILFDGESLLSKTPEQWRSLRGSDISMIFQDSGAMMNPIHTIGRQYRDFLAVHGLTDEKEAHDRMISMLEMVRLPDPEQVLKSYTYELSGGMRQRVGIAMAMSFHPKLLLADEPTSALDVTTQATIVKEMMEVRKNMNIAIIIVTHNMGVAAYMADNIMVMKNGEVVEYGKAEEVIYHPKTDYVKMLLAAVPSLGGKTTA